MKTDKVGAGLTTACLLLGPSEPCTLVTAPRLPAAHRYSLDRQSCASHPHVCCAVLCWVLCCVQRKLESSLNGLQRLHAKLKEKLAAAANKVHTAGRSAGVCRRVEIMGQHLVVDPAQHRGPPTAGTNSGCRPWAASRHLSFAVGGCASC